MKGLVHLTPEVRDSSCGPGSGLDAARRGREPWTAASRGDVLAGAGEEMAWLNVREPVSAWTHGLWLLLSLPASYVLWRLSRGDRVKLPHRDAVWSAARG